MEIIKDKETKCIFVGMSLGGSGTSESAVALIDRNKHIIMLDKIFSIADVKYYLNNLAGKQNAIIIVSIPENEVMLNNKWKYYSRQYDLVNFDTKMINKDDWTNRFSTRGCEYFRELKTKGIDIFRFDIENLKQTAIGTQIYKDRTPIDCKTIQDTLRIKYKMTELPINMLPAAQLEALLGAMLARAIVINENINEWNTPKKIGEYEGLDVIGTTAI